MSSFFPFFILLSVSVFYMLVVWLFSLKINNYSIVDIAWSAGFALLAILLFLFTPGFWVRKGLITAMVVIWSFRLAWHLAMRIYKLHPEEEGRYQNLRRQWKTQLPLKFFFFFEFQGLLLAFLSLPFLLIMRNGEPRLHFFEFTGAALWLIGVAGEATADTQLTRFKADPKNGGKTCEAGLWNYSRHPNYFFEWLIWVSYFVFALASPGGWVSLYAPLLMLYFLFKVTGIPATEEQALKSRGEEYRRYQQTTSVFVPWFKKEIRRASNG